MSTGLWLAWVSRCREDLLNLLRSHRHGGAKVLDVEAVPSGGWPASSEDITTRMSDGVEAGEKVVRGSVWSHKLDTLPARDQRSQQGKLGIDITQEKRIPLLCGAGSGGSEVRHDDWSSSSPRRCDAAVYLRNWVGVESHRRSDLSHRRGDGIQFLSLDPHQIGHFPRT
ncbi:uncharacterized protein N7506_007600 [Penicillium brevicompactum]|uniref:uncharacterized protein n=1 Tax=Penicillium brevicompactum TaxID=5074 RepID=UPI002540ED71|nr:uncharacterized protein N7506_007600 [Penicillium brevicompactum]KAJ5333817.1 hypothetical protein N7506_007600 [Penicillium brevicompactum]